LFDSLLPWCHHNAVHKNPRRVDAVGIELARLDRAIVRARGRGGEGVNDLARERQHALEAIHGVVTRLEKAV